jgi:hypothetical protein
LHKKIIHEAILKFEIACQSKLTQETKEEEKNSNYPVKTLLIQIPLGLHQMKATEKTQSLSAQEQTIYMLIHPKIVRNEKGKGI